MTLSTPTPSLPRVSILEKYSDADVENLTRPAHLRATAPRRAAAGPTSAAVKLSAYEMMDIANAAIGKQAEELAPVVEPELPLSPTLVTAMQRERTQLLGKRAEIDRAIAALDCLIEGAGAKAGNTPHREE